MCIQVHLNAFDATAQKKFHEIRQVENDINHVVFQWHSCIKINGIETYVQAELFALQLQPWLGDGFVDVWSFKNDAHCLRRVLLNVFLGARANNGQFHA